MPEPIEYRAIVALQALLQGIGGSGYFYPIVDTVVKLDPNHGVDELVAANAPRPFVLMQVWPEQWRYDPHGQLVLALPVTLHHVNDSDPTRDTDRLLTYWRGCADVEKAITQGGHNVDLGGLAREMRIVERTLSPDTIGSVVWAQIKTEITIDREYGKPNG